MNKEEKELVLQALRLAISRSKRELGRKGRLLLKADDSYQQSLLCKSIEIFNDRIVKFESLKRKIKNL